MPKNNKNTGIQQRLNSFRYAIKGIWVLVSTQANAQIHLLAICFVLILGFYTQISRTEWCIIILTCALVMALEAVNTAIETLTDLVSPEYHILAGKTKDIAAGAVLIAAIGAVIIGGLIFIPKFLY